MASQDRGWAGVGRMLLVVAASHGWVLVAGVLALIVVTYVGAYFLMSAIQREKLSASWSIQTPLLSITIDARNPPCGNEDTNKKKLKSDSP